MYVYMVGSSKSHGLLITAAELHLKIMHFSNTSIFTS